MSENGLNNLILFKGYLKNYISEALAQIMMIRIFDISFKAFLDGSMNWLNIPYCVVQYCTILLLSAILRKYNCHYF